MRVPAGEAVSRSFTRSWICSLEAFAAFDAGHVLDLLVARVLLRGRDHVATVVELPRDFRFQASPVRAPQCGVGGDDVDLAGEKASEGDAEAFLCHRRIRRACSSD